MYASALSYEMTSSTRPKAAALFASPGLAASKSLAAVALRSAITSASFAAGPP